MSLWCESCVLTDSYKLPWTLLCLIPNVTEYPHVWKVTTSKPSYSSAWHICWWTHFISIRCKCFTEIQCLIVVFSNILSYFIWNSMQRRIYPWAHWARAQGPPKIFRFREPRAKFRKTSELKVPLQTYLATMSINFHANRVLGTLHVTQHFLGVFQGAQIKSRPKALTDLNAALIAWSLNGKGIENSFRQWLAPHIIKVS